MSNTNRGFFGGRNGMFGHRGNSAFNHVNHADNIINRSGGSRAGMFARHRPHVPHRRDSGSTTTDSTGKSKKNTNTKQETNAMMKGKSMQQPQGFDAIDINYPRLTANDRTMILHTLLSNCTTGYTKKFVHEFRVKCEKANTKPTLWLLARALSEEITRLEGDIKMPSRKKLKTEDDNSQDKENKQSRNDGDESVEDKKLMTSIGSLSGDVIDTLAIWFRAHLSQKDHKAMIDAIEPTESPNSLSCCICSDDFDAEDTVACSGDEIHFFCKPCLSSYCTVTLQSGSIQSIPCALPNCKSLFATHDIKSVLSAYEILKIEHREESRDRRVALAAKAILHCECGVVAIVTEEDMGDGRITCPGDGCGKRFCAKCGNEDHGKESCPPPAETMVWLDKHSKKCPNCANRIEKNGGCDHMTCRPPGGCGHEFFWSCQCTYPGPHKCGRQGRW